VAKHNLARHDAPTTAGGSPKKPAAQRKTAPMPDLDRTIHERIRLGIISALAVNETLSFGDLKTLLDTTDGNLSVHARKLEDAGYVTCEKSFLGRQPHTQFTITAQGRAAIERYLNHMDALIKATRQR
jgi:DNA-binding MarR family transcriptional regulator